MLVLTLNIFVLRLQRFRDFTFGFASRFFHYLRQCVTAYIIIITVDNKEKETGQKSRKTYNKEIKTVHKYDALIT